jgi:Flp pilus assembly protein protease CpaA
LIPLIIISSIVLAIIGYSDVKSRNFHVNYLFVLVACGICFFYLDPQVTAKDILLNMVFLGFTFFCLFVYFSLRRKRRIDLFSDFIGIGDFLLFVALTPFFTMDEYLKFFVVSVSSALIVHLSLIIMRKTIRTIPLALYIGFGFYTIQLIDLLSKSFN